MKILPLQNNRSKTVGFRGKNSEAKTLIEQITNHITQVYPTVLKVKEDMLDFKPASTKMFNGMTDLTPGKFSQSSSFDAYIDFYSDFFTSLAEQKSPLLKNVKAMNQFSHQVFSIAETAKNEGDNYSARQSLLLLKKVYTYLKIKNLLKVKDEAFKIIDRDLLSLE